jgi:hypothetical protein
MASAAQLHFYGEGFGGSPLGFLLGTMKSRASAVL